MTVPRYSQGMDGNPTNDIEIADAEVIGAEVAGAEVTGREIATPEQRRLHRAEQKQRLRDQVEVLLRALEAIEPPKDFAGVERMAKAAVAVNKALDTICAEDKSEDSQEEDEMDDTFEDGEKRPPRDALDAWYVLLERKLDRLAAGYGQKTMADELGPPDMAAVRRRLADVGATRANPTRD
jgi:hypothetical protein